MKVSFKLDSHFGDVRLSEVSITGLESTEDFRIICNGMLLTKSYILRYLYHWLHNQDCNEDQGVCHDRIEAVDFVVKLLNEGLKDDK